MLDIQKFSYQSHNITVVVNNSGEIFARTKAFIDVEVLKSKPKFLGNKIDMTKPQTELSKL